MNVFHATHKLLCAALVDRPQKHYVAVMTMTPLSDNLLRIVVVSFLLLPGTTIAQQNTIDSLRITLARTTDPHDRLQVMNLMSRVWGDRNIDSAQQVNRQALALAVELKDTVGLAMAHFYKARIYAGENRFDRIYSTHSDSKEALALLVNPKFDIYKRWIESYSISFVRRAANMNVYAEGVVIDQSRKLISGLTSCRDEFISKGDYFLAALVEEDILMTDLPGFQFHHFTKCDELFGKVGHVEGIAKLLRLKARYTWYLAANTAETALKVDPMYKAAASMARRIGNTYEFGRSINGVAYCALYKNLYDSALVYARQAEAVAIKMKDAEQLMRYQQTFYDIYLVQKDGEKALPYIEKYLALKDSTMGQSTAFAITEMETRNMVLQKEQEAKAMEIEHRQERVYFTTATIALLLILGFGSYAYYLRQRANKELRKNMELQTLLQQNLETLLNEAQLTAARAQMNPHFVFNSINAIQNLILKENKTEAIIYLNDFSKLTRETLENSTKETILLKEEISFLNHYLQLESLRSSDKLTYKISCDPEIDINYERIPPMLVQPFVENAVKHGISPRGSGGHVQIDFTKQDENTLIISVKDDGIGREASAKQKLESRSHNSIATSLTETRLKKMSAQKSNGQSFNISIEDVLSERGEPGGTRVMIVIPLDLAQSLTA